MNRLFRFIFFGNFFYGLCAVALAVEASLQQHFPLDGILFYLLVFLATVLYYNVAYITDKPASAANLRGMWYARNLYLVKRMHTALTACFVVVLGIFILRYWYQILHMPLSYWALILVFPVVAVLYYGIENRLFGRFNLREKGWLKPFIIGFSWAGMVTVFPVLYYCIVRQTAFHPGLLNLLLFIKNFMFISLLCILFDIKDYAADYNRHLKTFVVNVGLRKTIFYIIIPLTVVGLGSFLTYGFTHGFSGWKIVLNTIPFLLLVLVAYSLYRRRSIFYYLVIIDGLMLVKAVCGSIAMLFF